MNDFRGITKDELFELFRTFEDVTNNTVLPVLDKIKEYVEDNDLSDVVDLPIAKRLKLDKDIDFYLAVEHYIQQITLILPSLQIKLKDELPELLTFDSKDLNVLLMLKISSPILFLSVDLVTILNYVINKFYDGSEEVNDKVGFRGLIELIRFIDANKGVEFMEVVKPVGNIIKLEEDKPPLFLLKEFFTTTFKVKGMETLSFLTSILDDEKPTLDLKFSGNPIYALRLFLIDLDMLKLERLNDDRRLLESRLLDLTNKEGDKIKIKQQQRFYENKLAKLDLKIEKLKKV